MSLSNAERQARWRARRNVEIERLRETARQGKSGPAPGPTASTARLKLEAALVSERNARRDLEVKLAYERTRRLAAEAGPKPARAPVDPESELGRAKAKIAELESRLRAVIKERNHRDQLLHGAGLSKATLNTVRKALHKDQAAHSTPESREAALATLNADLDRHEQRARR
jgi:hypothetical protein